MSVHPWAFSISLAGQALHFMPKTPCLHWHRPIVYKKWAVSPRLIVRASYQPTNLITIISLSSKRGTSASLNLIRCEKSYWGYKVCLELTNTAGIASSDELKTPESWQTTITSSTSHSRPAAALTLRVTVGPNWTKSVTLTFACNGHILTYKLAGGIGDRGKRHKIDNIGTVKRTIHRTTNKRDLFTKPTGVILVVGSGFFLVFIIGFTVVLNFLYTRTASLPRTSCCGHSIFATAVGGGSAVVSSHGYCKRHAI